MMRSLERWFPTLLLAPAIAPLLFLDGMYYPYLAPKTLFFRAAIILAFAAFATLILSGVAFHVERLKNRWTWLPALLLISAYASSIFGVDFYHSFWSVFDRGDGLLTLSGIVASFYLLLLALDEQMVTRFLKSVAWTGTIVAGFALLQWIEIASGINLPLPLTQGRIGSTLGNAAFLASYLSLTLFVTLVVAARVRAPWQNRAYYSAAAQFLAVIASATRGAVLALGLGLVLSLLYVAWKGSGKTRTYARYGLIALIVAGGIFLMFREQFAQAPIEVVRRVATISLTDATVESRLFLWENVGAAALETPILGTGAENIEVIFNRVYDPTALVEQWFDRAHNVYLDYFVQYGAIGLGLYLAILLSFALRSVALMRSSDAASVRMGELFLLMLIVYMAQNFFVFDTISSLWLFFALLAVLFVGNEKSTALIQPVPHHVPVIAGVLLAILVIPVVWKPLHANLLLGSGYIYHVADVNRSVTAMKQGLELGTYADLEYGYQLYEMYTERQMTMLQGAERMKAYQFARDTLETNLAKYPYDARTATYLSHVLDSAPIEARDEARVKEVVEHALELSPKRIQPWYIKTNIAIRAGDVLPPEDAGRLTYYREGIETLEEYSALVPASAEPRFVIATLYLTLGNAQKAAEAADAGLERYSRRDENTARRAARYYVLIEDWENASRFLADVVAEAEPVDYYAMYDLAKAEFILGNVEAAAEHVSVIQAEAPGLYETDPAFMAAFEAALE